MRILFLSRWFPHPADNGSKIRIANLLRQLATVHEVALVSFAEPEVSSRFTGKGAAGELASLCAKVEVVPYQPFQPQRVAGLVNFLSPRPRSVIATNSHEMHWRVQQLVECFHPDLLIATEIDMAPYALAVTRLPRLLEELEVALLHDAARDAGNIMQRLRRSLTWWKHAHYVRSVLRQFQGCTVVSQREQALVSTLAPAHFPLRIVPNGVDLSHMQGDYGAPQPNTLIYSGALTYSANADAMRYFTDQIWPLLLAQSPKIQLRITGRYTGVAPTDLPPVHPQITLTGYLPDIRPAVANSYLSIVPLRMGGGSRLKILESLALGTPVVTTRKGLEGLEIAQGEGVLIADTPAEFATAVLRALRDPGLRARLSIAGRKAVQPYDWSRIGGVLLQYIDEIVPSISLPAHHYIT